MAKAAEPDIRDRISNVFTRIEDITYIGLGVLLAAGALILLGAAAWFWGADSRGSFDPRDHGSQDPFRL